jgi:uncharacterized tellurite resistance protein B-like protein
MKEDDSIQENINFKKITILLNFNVDPMSITDIIDLFKLGKASAKSHMRNLIEIAAADGNLGVEEQRLLEYAAVRNNISKEQLKEIQENTSKVRFAVPRSERDKFHQLYDLVHMMSVDLNIHDEELRLCEIFAIKFGYRKEVVRQMIEMIRQNILKWIGPEETMQTVIREMKVYD